ncbi:MAG: ABC transporter permease [Phycisphaerales bacterium JB063]
MNLKTLKQHALRPDRLAAAATPVVLLTMLISGLLAFGPRFVGENNLLNMVQGPNAALGIMAIGMTLVILTGGIDLSVGAVLALVAVSVATLMDTDGLGWSFPAAAVFGLLIGAVFGTAQGLVVSRLRVPAFLVTLAGMFIARGAAFAINIEGIALSGHPQLTAISGWATEHIAKPLGSIPGLGWIIPRRMPMETLVLLVVIVLGWAILRWTRMGRTCYAIGGSPDSAKLMGLPVRLTEVGVYTLSGLCAAIAGLAHVVYTKSGRPGAGELVELDAIAVVVIGGTLLTGGRGSAIGTLVGLLTYATIRSIIQFGNFNDAVFPLVIGGLLLAFLVFQRVLQNRDPRNAH